MKKVTTHEYDKLYVMSLVVFSNGACDKESCWERRTRETINKMACYYPDDKDDFISDLSYATRPAITAPGGKLFAASECKTGRDTFRNSTYSITRDKTKAGIIAVPDIHPKLYCRMDCNLVAYDEENKSLYLASISKYGYNVGDDIGQVELQVAKNFIESSMKISVDSSTNPNLKVWFLPKCEELVEVMDGTKLSVPYIQESKIPVTPSTIISPETLVLWENIEDQNLLVRTICTSDWKKYPITLLVLLCGFRKDVNWYVPATGDFRRILQSIDYSNYYYYSNENKLGFLNFKKISKIDYEMLQGYIYCRFGVDKNGGVITAKQWESLPDCVKLIMQRRIVVKPFELPSAMVTNDLASILS